MSREEDPAVTLQRRAQTFRRARFSLLALVIGYFFLPYGVRAWIPVWLPFLAALGLEVQFFLGGYLQARRGRTPPARPDRGPQPRDLAELGGEPWRQAHVVELGDEAHLVPTEGLSEEEVHERIAAYVADPEAVLAETDAAPEPEYAPQPYRRHLAEAVAVVAVIAGLVFLASRPHGWDAVSTANRARTETVLSGEASRIAGHPASVRCDTSGNYVGVVQDADGLAVVGGNRAYLTPEICNTLYQLTFKHRVHSFSGTARAIAVLAHESWHLRGVADEGVANCYGFQSGVEIGERFGLSERTARAMMREQLATNAYDSGAEVQYRVSPDCRDGGDDDLHPEVRAFP